MLRVHEEVFENGIGGLDRRRREVLLSQAIDLDTAEVDAWSAGQEPALSS